MAWSFIGYNTAGNGTSATTKSVTLTNAAQVGDRIIALVVLDDNAATSVTDNLGNTYAQHSTADGGNPSHASVWSAPVTTAGTPTVTSNQTASRGGLLAAIYRGLSTAAGDSAVDVKATPATGTSGAPGPTASTAATSAANECCIAPYTDSGSAGPVTAGTGYTLHDGGNPWDRWDIEEKDSGSSGTTQSANTNSSAGSGAIQFLLVFKLAATAQTYQIAGVGASSTSGSAALTRLVGFELSRVGAQYALDIVTGRSTNPFASVSRTVYVALLTSAPTDASTMTNISSLELTMTGYVRKPVPWTAPSNASPPETHNSVAVDFGPFSGALQQVTNFALVSASSGTTGDFLAWGLVSPPVTPSSGQTLHADVGDFTFSLTPA